ncbi:hypothetical protein TB1_045065 [Malus domestica]
MEDDILADILSKLPAKSLLRFCQSSPIPRQQCTITPQGWRRPYFILWNPCTNGINKFPFIPSCIDFSWQRTFHGL